MKKHLLTSYRLHKQRGIVLVAALIMLLILTLLGVTAMNTTNLQTLMAGNNQFQTLALSQAEATVQSAEAVIENVITTKIIPAQGFINATGNLNPIDFTTYDWIGNAQYFAVDPSNFYIIEYTGVKNLPSDSFKWINGSSTAGNAINSYRVTTRSTNGRGAVRIVQAIYTTLGGPY